MYAALGSHVLIRVNKQTDEELASGLVIPAGEDPQAIGEVVSAGPLTYEDIAAGKTVLFQPFRSVQAWHEGEDLLVILEDVDIFAIIEEGGGE